jgi:hypothetical protein
VLCKMHCPHMRQSKMGPLVIISKLTKSRSVKLPGTNQRWKGVSILSTA